MRRAQSGRSARTLGNILSVWLWVSLVGCAGWWPGSQEPESPFDPNHTQYRNLMKAQHANKAASARAAAAPGAKSSVRSTVAEADLLREKGELKEAVFTYLEAYRLDPEDPQPQERIALVHLKDDPERAEAIFQGLIDKGTATHAAHTGLAVARLRQGRLKEAVAPAEKGLELAPNSSMALTTLGILRDRTGRHGEAQALFERSLALRPEDPATLNNLGVSYLLSGRLVEAEEVLRRGLLMAPSDLSLHNDLGLVLARQGRYREALTEFREGGSEQSAQNNLGYAYFLNGQYPEALEHYELALLQDGEEKIIILRNIRTTINTMETAQQEAEARARAEAAAAAKRAAEEVAALAQAAPEPGWAVRAWPGAEPIAAGLEADMLARRAEAEAARLAAAPPLILTLPEPEVTELQASLPPAGSEELTQAALPEGPDTGPGAERAPLTESELPVLTNAVPGLSPELPSAGGLAAPPALAAAPKPGREVLWALPDGSLAFDSSRRSPILFEAPAPAEGTPPESTLEPEAAPPQEIEASVPQQPNAVPESPTTEGAPERADEALPPADSDGSL